MHKNRLNLDKSLKMSIFEYIESTYFLLLKENKIEKGQFTLCISNWLFF